MPISDTTPAAQAVQLEIHRAMSGERKLQLAYEMSMAGRDLKPACGRNNRRGPKSKSRVN